MRAGGLSLEVDQFGSGVYIFIKGTLTSRGRHRPGFLPTLLLGVWLDWRTDRSMKLRMMISAVGVIAFSMPWMQEVTL